MVILYRETEAGAFTSLAAVGRELSDATGVAVEVGVEEGVNLSGATDPTVDRLRLVCASAPVEATIDAALASYPTTGVGVTGSVSVTKNVPFLLYERVVGVGEILVVQVTFMACMGTVASMKPEYFRAETLVWRESSGDVQTDDVGGPGRGRIPGFQVTASGSTNTFQIHGKTKLTGTMEVLINDVAVFPEAVIS
jgi:hypothetical protein